MKFYSTSMDVSINWGPLKITLNLINDHFTVGKYPWYLGYPHYSTLIPINFSNSIVGNPRNSVVTRCAISHCAVTQWDDKVKLDTATSPSRATSLIGSITPEIKRIDTQKIWLWEMYLRLQNMAILGSFCIYSSNFRGPSGNM